MAKQVVHLIASLGKGGAETMLYQVLRCRTREDLSYKVVSLGSRTIMKSRSARWESRWWRFLCGRIRSRPLECSCGSFAARTPRVKLLDVNVEQKEINFKLLDLDKAPTSDLLEGVLCCWMYHANLIGYYMGRLAGVKRIVWGIHHSDLSPQINKSATLRLNQWCARISRHVDVVSYTGNAARAVHEQVGYCRTNGVVLSNGCDCAKYCPDASKREAVHQELSIPMETRIVFSAALRRRIPASPLSADKAA